MPALDLSGVVTATMVIAGLGVLNDVTVTQASAVWELRVLRPTADRRAVFASAMRIGRDHIASSVYTLVFAYAGSAMTVLLLITAYQRGLAEIATSEEIGQEIVRTLVGRDRPRARGADHHGARRVHGAQAGCRGAAHGLSGISARGHVAAVGSSYPQTRGFMTDDDIAEGWYTDSEGAIRWWDGARWTEHVRSESGDPAATVVLPADRSEPVRRRILDDEDDDEPDHSRRLWLTATFVGLLAFFLGMAIGGNGNNPDPAIVEEATAASGATAADLDQRETDLKTREGEVESKQQDLDQREQDLESRERDLESAPSGTGTGPMGNGVFEVGDDVQPGQYASDGPEDPELPCSYRVSDDEDGEEIISSEISDGPGIVTLVEGQYFTSEYCQTWELQ